MSQRNRPDRDRRRRQRGAHRYRRGETWWAYLGRGDRVSLKTRDEAEAERRFRELVAGRRVARRAAREETNLADISRKYLDAPHGWTKRTHMSATHRAVAFVVAVEVLGALRPGQLTDTLLDRWRTARMKVVSRATVNRDEDVATKMLRWAVSRGLCDMNPMENRDRLREPERPNRKVIPSPEEIRRAVAHLQGRGLTGVALYHISAAATGLRIDELRRLPESDVVRDAVFVRPEAGPAATAWTSKGFRERRIPCAPEVLTAVRRFIAWRTEHRSAVSDGWVNRHTQVACAAIGIPRFTAHDLRRTFATECVRAMIPLPQVQDWMGHKDLRTTQRYIGSYRSDSELVAPRPAALELLDREPVTAIPFTRGRPPKGTRR